MARPLCSGVPRRAQTLRHGGNRTTEPCVTFCRLCCVIWPMFDHPDADRIRGAMANLSTIPLVIQAFLVPQHTAFFSAFLEAICAPKHASWPATWWKSKLASCVVNVWIADKRCGDVLAPDHSRHAGNATRPAHASTGSSPRKGGSACWRAPHPDTAGSRQSPGGMQHRAIAGPASARRKRPSPDRRYNQTGAPRRLDRGPGAHSGVPQATFGVSGPPGATGVACQRPRPMACRRKYLQPVGTPVASPAPAASGRWNKPGPMS